MSGRCGPCLLNCQHAFRSRPSFNAHSRLDIVIGHRLRLSAFHRAAQHLDRPARQTHRLGGSSQHRQAYSISCRAVQGITESDSIHHNGHMPESVLLADGAASYSEARAEESSSSAGPSWQGPTSTPEDHQQWQPASREAAAVQTSDGPHNSASSRYRGSGGESESATTLGTVRERLSRELTRERGTVEGTPASSSNAAPAMQQVLYSQKEHLRRLRTGEDAGLDPAEALRRLRISESNKGRVPWNKGIKHAPGKCHAFHRAISQKLVCITAHLLDSMAMFLLIPCTVNHEGGLDGMQRPLQKSGSARQRSCCAQTSG